MAQKNLAIMRYSDASAVLFHQRLANDRFQLPDGPGHGGLGQMQHACGAADAALPGNLDKGLKMPQFQSAQIIHMFFDMILVINSIFHANFIM